MAHSALLRCSAPRLPPVTSSMRASSGTPSSSRPSSRVAEKIDARTGQPVTTTFEASETAEAARSYVKHTDAAFFARYLLVMPMTEFCSCNTNGMPIFSAARPTGIVTYPPKPTTTSGFISANHFLAAPVLFASTSSAWGMVSGCERLKPSASNGLNGIPASLTHSDSRPTGLPANCTSTPRSRKTSAVAIAGLM